MEFILKYRVKLMRIAGVVLLLLGFVINFWDTPKSGMSKNELAAINLARMEASVSGKSNTKIKKKTDSSSFVKALESTQKKQLKYLTILVMLLGFLSLAFSFIKKDKR